MRSGHPGPRDAADRRATRPGLSVPFPALGLLVLLLFLPPAIAGCLRRPPGAASVHPVELGPAGMAALLERQNRELEELVAAARRGPLMSFDQVLVTVSQGLVQQLLSAATPYTRVVGDKYRVRVDSVTVNFRNGFALVRADGRASLARQPEDQFFADVSLYSDLRVEELDRRRGVLRARLAVIAIEARSVSLLGMKAPARKLVEDLARERLEKFGEFATRLEIPVRLEQKVTLPEVGPGGDVRIPRAEIPLQASVQQVRAVRGRLWIAVSLSIPPEEPGRP